MRRALPSGLILSALFALAGCEQQTQGREAFAESQVPPSLGGVFLPPEAWAWGFLQNGDGPVHRYGVSAPPVGPRAQVIILPGYGESAEGWFETARDLNIAGINVWVLEAAGQGGSERLVSPRDLGHTRDLSDDAQTLRAFVNTIVRPRGEVPVILLTSGSAAPIGLKALEGRGIGVTTLVISDPQTLSPAVSSPAWLTRSTSRAPGQQPWQRPRLDGVSPRRDAAERWPLANPDLRMGGYSVGYLSAWTHLADAVTRPDRLRSITASVLIISRTHDLGADTCQRVRRCRQVVVPASQPFQWATDPARRLWLNEVIAVASAPTDHTM